MPQAQPELKKVRQSRSSLTPLDGKRKASNSFFSPTKYMEKRLFIQLNGNRKVIGILRGYDVFMNIVLDEAIEEKPDGEKVRIGMVVIRGNSVVMLEVRSE
ncbi:hypothetical protein PISL3812_09200 [Talaromyces islandicus]|uniref:Small nuclear ribonucleoprotein G n=1 Tax=Talaromyces islandicus TaxID=28573 RepID=A0A0U1M918_TALIS|nr:hypothetical protein PISL3812_09200 [Talaromyces islandicus]